ncbi:MAG: HAD hydrolase-like protein [Oscillospiraceae bacterium]
MRPLYRLQWSGPDPIRPAGCRRDDALSPRHLPLRGRRGPQSQKPAFFDYCFAHMPGARREETLLIGDNLRTDIRGGQRAGLRTCWFNARRRPEDPAIQPNWTVYSWAEVLSLL